MTISASTSSGFLQTAPQSQGGFYLPLNIKIKPCFLTSNNFKTAVQIKLSSKYYSQKSHLFNFGLKSYQFSKNHTRQILNFWNKSVLRMFQKIPALF